MFPLFVRGAKKPKAMMGWGSEASQVRGGLEPGSRNPTPPPKPPICKLFAVFWLCTLFAAFESHNFVTGPCLAVYFSHINLNLAESSTYYPKPAYVLPIPYLTHGLPLIVCRYLCHMFATYRLYTQRAPMDTYIILYYMLGCSMHLQRHVYTYI